MPVAAKEPKVFKINDYEWWLALDEQSLLIYLRQNGYDDDEFGDPLEMPFSQLSGESMQKLQFVGDDGKIVSFQQEYEDTLKRIFSSPTMFATTEW